MKEAIEKHLEENLKKYFILSLFLIIGVFIGIMTINNATDIQKNEINEYLTNFITSLKETNKINYTHLLVNSIKNNLKIILFIILISMSLFGKIGVFGATIYKGYKLGYSISSAVIIFGTVKGLIFSGTLILINNIIWIPTIFYISTKSLNIYKDILECGNKRDLKYLILQYIISIAISIGFMLIASLIETYINSNLFLMFLKLF